ncbi:MAG: PAS domain-containing protein [Alphaproteobacteria bacterium]|nr:PAS domain-containing protein [Alphaproteobacteria bacterium]
MARTSRRTGQTKAKAAAASPSACIALVASDAGLDGLRRVFAGLPPDSGASYLVAVGGEAPLPAGRFVEALSGATSMSVEVAGQGIRPEPNHVYVAPHDQVLTVDGGRLRLAKALPTDGRVDSLLVSAAEAYEENAVVVVLAALGADGAAGVAATKRCGGFAIAEGDDQALEPEGQAVTAAGIADMRLPVERIAPEIAAYVANLIRTGDGEALARTLQQDVGQQIARIAAILRNATGNDFHGYKHATFLRRIQRRMQVVHLDTIAAYIDRLRADSTEVQHLFQDLLIGVTQFFRDPAEFEVLEREVIPKLFEGRGADDRLRIWVLGCATGEEAYSLAILVREQMARMEVAPHIQIFATDIDARALAVARSGRYPDSVARHVSQERLARWFVREGATYSVVKDLREMCIFSPHNLIKDAPFSRIDLLSCRNVLIYLNSELQDRVIPIFHFSLRPGGYLFLGPAENITRHQKLFAPIDRRNRIFRRLDTSARVLPDFPLSPRSDRPDPAGDQAWRNHAPRPLGGRTGRRMEQVAERYAPAYVVVDENHDVLHFSGRTGRFLEPASGAATLNLLNLVHRDLRLDLRSALHNAETHKKKVEARNVLMGADGSARAVNMVVEPISSDDEPGAVMVVFQDAAVVLEGAPGAEAGAATDEHVHRLETELRITRERLQTTIEELESTNEELKSSNEEYQSINEELQSANEELETSKEELQAVNEELQTVNGELAHRVGDLARANSDLKNLLESTQIATVFLDNDLRLRSFTPASTDVFHFIEADVGRPIAHIAARVNYPELQDDARRVLKTLGQIERRVMGSEEDRQFLVRVLPYRSVDNFIAGVVVTFLEITGTVRAEAALRTSERRFAEAQQLAGVGVWEWNPKTDETWWSPVVYRLWGLPQADAPPPVDKLPIHPDDRQGYLARLARDARSGTREDEWRVVLPDGAIRWLAATGRAQPSEPGGRMRGVVQDVTARKQTETRLTLLLGELQHRVRNMLGVVRSIVDRSIANADSLDDLASHLDGRLQTMARTQSVLTRTGVATVDLEEMIRDEMVAVAAREEQLTIRGPSLRLRREAAETLALALHELTTNAVKYGALSEPAGSLSITWRIVNDGGARRLALEWKENGVRAIDTNPARSGFGRELIERGLPYELGAEASLEFARGGVRASIGLPLNDKIAELQGGVANDAAT